MTTQRTTLLSDSNVNPRATAEPSRAAADLALHSEVSIAIRTNNPFAPSALFSAPSA